MCDTCTSKISGVTCMGLAMTQWLEWCNFSVDVAQYGNGNLLASGKGGILQVYIKIYVKMSFFPKSHFMVRDNSKFICKAHGHGNQYDRSQLALCGFAIFV